MAKVNSKGVIEWLVTGGVGNSSTYANDIARDQQGNLYITGRCNGAIIFGSKPYICGSFKSYVVKLTAAGKVVWVATAGGSSSNHANSIAVDAAGNAVIAGKFWTNVAFGKSSLYSSASFGDFFVAGLDSKGKFIWASGSAGNTQSEANGVAIDGKGNSYVIATYSGAFKVGTTSLVSAGSDDIAVAKLSSKGQFLWATSAGGSSSTDRGYGVAADAAGNAFITGHFGDNMGGAAPRTAAFGSHTLTSKGGVDLYLAKLNTTGKFIWAVSGGGSGHDDGYDVALGSGGQLYVTGEFDGAGAFGGVKLSGYGSKNSDVMVLKASAGGTFQAGKQAPGAGTYNRAHAVTVDKASRVFVAGSFYGPGYFGSTFLSSKGSADWFAWMVPKL